MELTKVSKQRTFLMGCAILAVLLSHEQYIHVPVFSAGSWGVDVFMFLSGMGITYSLRKNDLRTYYCNRLIRILPAVLLALAFFYAWDWYVTDMRPHNALLGGVIWFIRVIICFYIISPLFLQALEKWGASFIWWLTACLLVPLCILGHPAVQALYAGDEVAKMLASYTVAWGAKYVPVYVLGMAYALFPSSARMEKWSRPWHGGWWVCILAAVILHLLFKGVLGEWFGVHFPKVVMNYAQFVQTLFLCWAVPGLCHLLAVSGGWVSRHMRWGYMAVLFCGTVSLELYMMHMWVFHFSDELFGVLPGGCRKWWVLLPLSTGLSVLLAWGLHTVCKPFTWLRTDRQAQNGCKA